MAAGKDSPKRQQLLKNLKTMWEGVQSRPRPSRDEAIDDVSRMLAAHVARSLETPKVVRRSAQVSNGRMFSAGSLRRWVGYAGAAVAVFAAWWAWSANGKVAKLDTYSTYTTHAGQRAKVTLRDGSQVILGPASALRVARGESSDRTIAVEITGEALFTVNHATQRPFSVTAHGVTTRVLGTEFVVRAYDASRVRVAVREGRVSVQSLVFTSPNAVIVAAGEATSVTPNTSPSVIPITDLATDFAWAKGELVLRGISLGEALVRLSRWYGMDFRVTDSSLLSTRVAANFLATFNESEIEVLARAVGARSTRSGNTITFSPAK